MLVRVTKSDISGDLRSTLSSRCLRQEVPNTVVSPKHHQPTNQSFKPYLSCTKATHLTISENAKTNSGLSICVVHLPINIQNSNERRQTPLQGVNCQIWISFVILKTPDSSAELSASDVAKSDLIYISRNSLGDDGAHTQATTASTASAVTSVAKTVDRVQQDEWQSLSKPGYQTAMPE